MLAACQFWFNTCEGVSMVPIARRNLLAEKLRLAIAIGGVAFAVFLIVTIQSLYYGFRSGAGDFARQFPASLWVVQPGIGDTFNEQFGNIEWKDADKVGQVIAVEIPAKVSADTAYQNAMKNSDKQNARIEHDMALQRVLNDLLADNMELFKLYSDNPAFKKWLQEKIFAATYEPAEV
jgi:hypothetical protein